MLKSEKYLPWLLLLLVHVCFIAAGIYYNRNLTKDSAEYLQQAVNLRSHLTFYCGPWNGVLKPEWFSLRPPGYGIFLAFFSWGSLSVVLPLIIQGVLSILSIIITWRIVLIIAGREINPYLFMLPLTAFAVQFIYSGMIMSEILFQFFIVLMVASAVMYHHSDKLKWGVLFIVFTTMAMLVKPVMWLFPVLFFPVALWLVFRKGYSKKILLTFLIPFMVIASMYYRNYVLTGEAEYSSVSRKLLINYNIPALLEKRFGSGIAYHRIDSLQEEVSSLPYADRCRIIDSFVRDAVADAPLEYLEVHFHGMVRFFFDTGRWEWRNYFPVKDEWKGVEASQDFNAYMQQWSIPALVYQLYCLLMNIFLLFTLGYFIFSKKVDIRNRRFIAALIIYIAVLTGPSASARFRLPVFPLQLITCAVFFVAGKKPVESIEL